MNLHDVSVLSDCFAVNPDDNVFFGLTLPGSFHQWAGFLSFFCVLWIGDRRAST